MKAFYSVRNDNMLACHGDNTGESNNFCTLLAHVLAQQVNYPVGKEAASTRKEHSKAEVGNVWQWG